VLANRLWRPDALEWAQEYRQPARTRLEKKWTANGKKLLARPDVRERLAQVGRIDRYPIFN
jgi:uncharacterized protein (DUF302 family)